MTIDRTRCRFSISVILVMFVSLAVVVSSGGNAFAAQGDTTRVSLTSTGGEANDGSEQAAISDDGQHVAFQSVADNVVVDDTNGLQDVFVHDLDTGVITRVSVDSAGTQANSDSYVPAISGDGRYVTFQSEATNLVADDTNNAADVFVHDRSTGDTTRVSVASAGTQATGGSFNPAISRDGRYVAFQSEANDLDGNSNGAEHVFVHDRDTLVTTRVSVDSAGTQATGNSQGATISDDGGQVAFYSYAVNLVADDTNNSPDVFVHDRDTDATTRVSVDSDGIQANGNSFDAMISGDGRYVSFGSGADNLVTGDTNMVEDVFVHDRDTDATTRVSVATAGVQATGDSWYPVISGDGRFVTFYSPATNLVTDDTNNAEDVFVHDRDTRVTTRVSVDSAGAQANGDSSYPTISRDGGHIAFQSSALNLVAGDTNAVVDVFVHQYGADPVVTTTTTTPDATTTTEPSTTTTTQPPVVTPDDAFTDDDNSVFEDDINKIAAAGITMGCNPPVNDEFCPNDPLTRGEMAAFLNRALHLTPPNTDWFTDDNTSGFESDINSAANAGITRGCNPPLDDQYCPDDNLTRGQMAAFLSRAFDLAPSSLDWFTDDNTSIFQTDINSAAGAGITRGCNPPVNDRYCADDYLTRGQMAALLNRAITHHNDRTTRG